MKWFINNHKDVADIRSQLQLTETRIKFLTDLVHSMQKKLHELTGGIQSSEAKSTKPKWKRVQGSYADGKYAPLFAYAIELHGEGLDQSQIAEKLNDVGFKTPQGKEFRYRHVSDLLSNETQMKNYLKKRK